jgi:hypothetical protein
MIKLAQVQNGERCGITRGNGSGSYLLSPGIKDPLCGWSWLLGREHPENDFTIELITPGSRVKATLNPEAHQGNIVKEWARAALARG